LKGLPEAVVTDVHAVQLKDGANADQVAASLGFVNLGPVTNLKNVFRFQHVHEAGHQRRGAAVRLAAHPEVELEEVQIKRKRFVRRMESINDPLWPQQWNLQSGNVGLNVQAVWKGLNITGRGAQGVLMFLSLFFLFQHLHKWPLLMMVLISTILT
jgi:hypothetical protein